MSIRENIIECLKDIGIYVESGENLFLSEIIEDSIVFVSLLLEIEENFGIEFPDEVLIDTRIETLEDLYNIVEGLLKDNDIALQ